MAHFHQLTAWSPCSVTLHVYSTSTMYMYTVQSVRHTDMTLRNTRHADRVLIPLTEPQYTCTLEGPCNSAWISSRGKWCNERWVCYFLLPSGQLLLWQGIFKWQQLMATQSWLGTPRAGWLLAKLDKYLPRPSVHKWPWLQMMPESPRWGRKDWRLMVASACMPACSCKSIWPLGTAEGQQTFSHPHLAQCNM